MPSNAPGYVMSIIDDGQGTFKGRGIDDGSILETVTVDFAFDEQLRDGRSRLTMSGELLYPDHVELRGVRLELAGCDGRPGVLHLQCPLDE
jgi:hypothetical protein